MNVTKLYAVLLLASWFFVTKEQVKKHLLYEGIKATSITRAADNNCNWTFRWEGKWIIPPVLNEPVTGTVCCWPGYPWPGHTSGCAIHLDPR